MSQTKINSLEANPSMAPSIRLGAIAFVNTIPIYTALQQTNETRFELVFDSPAKLNAMIDSGELDVSPVSSAYYLANQDKLVLLDNLSVSSPGAVESVLFLSKMDMTSSDFLESQTFIPVPDDSETSVNLLAWLLEQKTGQNLRVRFKVMPAGDYYQTLEQYGASLIIGDNALRVHETPAILEHYHIYDLSSEWVQAKNLPFVFAVWVARKSWAEAHAGQLEQINALLVQSKQLFFNEPDIFNQGIVNAKMRCDLPEALIKHYFMNALTYGLEASHYQALEVFSEILLNAKNMAMVGRSW